MRGKMGKPREVPIHFWVVAISLLTLMGCSSATGSSFGALSSRNPMLPAAKRLRTTASYTAPLPRELDVHVQAPYIVEQGDVLLVHAVDPDSPARLPGDQPVLQDGTINLGRYGQVVVAGKTVNEIETIVRAAVQSQTSGKDVGPFTVRLMTRVSKVYYVMGEVNTPGAFPLSGRETVLDGIVAAGGLTDRGSRTDIILSRPSPPDNCRVVLPICYRQIVQLGDTTTNYKLAPGDRIFVASKSLSERLFGICCENQLCNGPQCSCSTHAADSSCRANSN